MPTVDVSPWIGNSEDADPHRRVLVLPGMQYPIGMPLLYLPALALRSRGWTIWHATWDLRDIAEDESALTATIGGALRALADSSDVARGDKTLVLAKSIGTRAAPVAAELELPAVWLTPLVRNPLVADAIGNNPSPSLLIGGTADSAWDPAVAATTGQQVLDIPDADHSLFADDWRRFLADLELVTASITDFADAL